MHKIVGVRWSDLRRDPKPPGRVCETEGCETVLSTYNNDPICAACEEKTVRSPATRRRRQPAGRDIEHQLPDTATDLDD